MDSLIKQQIATVARDITYPSFMGVLINQDDTLLTRGGGVGLKIYDDIERDTHAFAVLQKRKMAVVSYPWDVEPASQSRADKKAADIVKEQLTALNYDKLTVDLLDAILKGFSVGEIMWNTDGSTIYVDDVIPRNQRRFKFDDQYQLCMLTPSDMMKGELMPDRKFIVHSIGAKDGSPYGLGLGSKLFWPVFFKRQNITFWMAFADKFGSPTVVGKYPAGTGEPDQDTLKEALEGIAQETAIVVPEGMLIELLEAARSGSADFYEKLCRYMDDQISIAVLGETMTTTSKGAGMGSNQAQVHNDVRLELARADGDLLSGTLCDTLVKWITEFNVPGATPPKVWRKIEEQEDLKARAERDQILYGLGFKPTQQYITDTYGDGWEPRDMTPPAVTPAGNDPENPDKPAAFSENELFPDQQALDDAIALIPDNVLSAQMKTMLKPVVDLIEAGKDGAEVMGALAEIYPKMDTGSLEEILARMMFLVDLWGRINANTDAS